ncbi:hypothetical protein L3Q82_010088 [Scortum barcoo]|uniref:Uncharacterized protein n=1 Tax=Scortum barcoo TaxID=214431 RepID=A0ACB8WBI5_9TELE|nr:hypothetical protein L3Q82_010088 [Scortum barcoo]
MGLCRWSSEKQSPVELFNEYSVKDMAFNPPVAPPGSKRKVRTFKDSIQGDRFVVGATLLDAELQRRAESLLTATATDTELDFTTTHTHTDAHCTH